VKRYARAGVGEQADALADDDGIGEQVELVNDPISEPAYCPAD